MTRPRISMILWMGVALMTVFGWIRWNRAAVDTVSTKPPVNHPLTGGAKLPLDSAGALGRTIAARDPFRLARRPTAVPYRPDGLYQPAEPTAEPNRPPPVALTGILGGPPWRALVRTGGDTRRDRVVVTGDTVAGFRVAIVARDSLVLESPDTTLSVRLGRQ